jgi:lipopolysaccharide transport system ATP-binding protein
MSSDIVVQASGVGKRYTLGRVQSHGSLRDSLMNAASGLFRPRARATESSFWALEDVGFEVRRGDVIGLIGRNGAGKSTLLKILSRITEPTTGEVRLRGRVGSLLEVGTGFHPELTGRENIFLNGAILGMRKGEIAKKFDEIVAFAEIDKFLDTQVKFYSSGMYMRLAFAVAAHLEPEILVVDEVLAVGDSAFQKKCLGKMGAVATEGRTVIFVSHNMGAINRLCQTALWLDKGRIVEYGPTGQVVANYLIVDSSDAGQCEWPEGIADRNVDEFRLYSVRIQSPQGAIASVVDVRYPFILSFDYEFRKQLPYCRVGFYLSTADGTALFESYDTDQEANQGARRPGRYKFRCEVPGHFLLPGAYSISVVAGMPNIRTLLWRENVLSLTVEETAIAGDIRAQPYGLIRPKLKWEKLPE